MMSRRTITQWRLTGAAAVATLLTSLCLTPTLTEGRWTLRTVVMVLLVAGTGGLLRQWSTPRLLIPVVQFVTIVVAAAAMFAAGSNAFTVVPTLTTVTDLLDLGAKALDSIWNEPSPIAGTNAVSMVVTVGVGLVALTVDALAVTWRKPTLAGVPLFVLYLVPAAVLPAGVPWPLFVLAGSGWILIQLADGRERLTHWGRVVGVDGDVTGGASALTGTGRRLGVTALVAAVAIPMVIPSIGEGVLGGGGGGDGSGDGQGEGRAETAEEVVTLNPIVDLKRDLTQTADTEVFRYTSTDPSPQYWRTATLDSFDGTTWSLADAAATESMQAATGLPEPPGLADDVARTAHSSEVQVTRLNSQRLPLPYPTTRVVIEGDWRWDPDTLDVFAASESGNALGTSYTAESLDIEPTAAQLLAAPEALPAMATFLAVPDDIRDLLAADTATALDGQDVPYLQAQALQNWFRSEFEYSLKNVAGNDADALSQFLADRSGYCEQFAASMALMARIAGIPSRVQVGFTPGTLGDDGTWQVTAHDAHAWPELWFEGIGWVRFEPTPGGGDGNAAPAWAPPPVDVGNNPQANPNNSGPDLRRNNPALRPDDTFGSRLQPFERANGRSVTPEPEAPPGPDRRLLLLLLLSLTMVALAAPVVTRRLTSARRWRAVTDEGSAITAAWDEVLAMATDVDLAPDPTRTPRDLATSLPRAARMSSTDADLWRRLCRAIELQRYARREFTGTDEAQLRAWRECSDTLTSGLLAGVSNRDRRRARWWPVSGRRDLTIGWNRWMDAAATAWQSVLAGLGRRLRRS